MGKLKEMSLALKEKLTQGWISVTSVFRKDDSDKRVRELRKQGYKCSDGMVEKHSGAGLAADIVIYAILLLALFVCIVPIWHVLMASFSDGQKFFAGEGLTGGIAWIPVAEAHTEAYGYLFARWENILSGFGNSILYVVGATLFGMIVNISAAYVLSRKSKLRPYLMVFVMFTIMFNGGLIPTYKVVQSLGWINTRWALLIPGCTNAFFVIMLSNAFAAVPESTIEAAELDGAGHLRIMWQVVLPQSMSFTSVIILNSVVLQWNAWINASIYLDSRALDLYPLQLWLREWIADSESFLVDAAGSLLGPDYNGQYLMQYAAIIVGMLPVLLVFPFFQKRMEKGQLQGAVKG